MNKAFLLIINFGVCLYKINSGCCGSKPPKSKSEQTYKDFNKENLMQDLEPFFVFSKIDIELMVNALIVHYNKNEQSDVALGKPDNIWVTFQKGAPHHFFIIVENNKYKIVTNKDEVKVKLKENKNIRVIEFYVEGGIIHYKI